MGALLVLSLKNNSLRADGGKALAEGLKGSTVITGLDISGNNLSSNASGYKDMAGITAFADAITDMGAMTSLNLASNGLLAGGAKIAAEAIKATKCTPAIILVPLLCPANLSAGYEGDDQPQSFDELDSSWRCQVHRWCFEGQ
jgi:hypothetical protein